MHGSKKESMKSKLHHAKESRRELFSKLQSYYHREKELQEERHATQLAIEAEHKKLKQLDQEILDLFDKHVMELEEEHSSSDEEEYEEEPAEEEEEEEEEEPVEEQEEEEEEEEEEPVEEQEEEEEPIEEEEDNTKEDEKLSSLFEDDLEEAENPKIETKEKHHHHHHEGSKRHKSRHNKLRMSLVKKPKQTRHPSTEKKSKRVKRTHSSKSVTKK